MPTLGKWFQTYLDVHFRTLLSSESVICTPQCSGAHPTGGGFPGHYVDSHGSIHL